MTVSAGEGSVPIFPIIRHLSRPASRVLARMPVTPNQITALSLLCGLLAVVLLTQTGFRAALLGGVAFCACYVLDNADGEIARLKNSHTEFGARFDTFVDWLVHALVFPALGYRIYASTGQGFWLLPGAVATLGATLNYVIGLIEDRRSLGVETDAIPAASKITNPLERVAFVFRELLRADFCFILLALCLLGLDWLLVLTGAIGAQAYWLAGFVKGVRRHHV